jgi:SNF family Na+-dependent transporter
MKTKQSREPKFLAELVRMFEQPSETARRYLKFSRCALGLGVACVVFAGVLGGLEKARDVEMALLIVAGATLTASLFWRLASEQVAVLTKYSVLKADEAKDALPNLQ